MRPALAAAVAAALVLAGFGGSGDAGRDGRWARAIVISKSDLPTFHSEPPLSTRTCLPGHLDGQTAFARSLHFSSGARSVTARAWIFPEERHARGGFHALVARDYAQCLKRDGIVGARILVSSQKEISGSRSGDRFRALRVTVRVRQAGTTFTVALPADPRQDSVPEQAPAATRSAGDAADGINHRIIAAGFYEVSGMAALLVTAERE